MVKTEASGCSVKVDWTAPENGGTAIQGYKVEIVNKAGQNVSLMGACGNKNISARTTCIVPMTLLVADPINLKVGDVVYVQVAAKNVNGFGKLSPKDIASKVRLSTLPSALTKAPTSKMLNYKEAIVNWGIAENAD